MKVSQGAPYVSFQAVPHPALGFGLTLLDYPGLEYSLNVNMLSVLLSFWQT